MTYALFDEHHNGMIDAERKARILLLDDDTFLINMYGIKFSHEGYEVQSCLNGKEAIEVLRGGFAPDAIVFDLIMPEFDGFAFLSALTSEKLAKDSVKIALTNQSNDADIAKVKEMGADRAIVKASMIPSEVVNIVAEEIAKKRRSG